MKLTACWITKNEENNIGKSIESVSGAVDKMIVVDTGSEDNTAQIAREKGAEVLDFKWISDFAAAKNFALENADHGIVIFLDADEYFDEPLNEEDKKSLIEFFELNKKIDVLSVHRDDIEMSDGTVRLHAASNRILRHNGHVYYVGKIHEEMMRDGEMPAVGLFPKTIIHTGYSKELLEGKARRNAEMLDEVADGTVDTYESFNQQIYIIRENATINPEKAFESWKKVAPQTRRWEYGIMRYRDDFISHLMRAILIALNNRSRVSRKFVYKYLIDLFKKRYKDYKMAPLMDLLYIQFYDKRDDLFLDKFDAAMEEANKKTWKDLYEKDDYLIKMLYATAAQAASKRGQTERAAEYAQYAIDNKIFDAVQAALLSMIIDYALSKEPAQTIEILSKMYSTEKQENKRFLTAQLMRDDAKDLYIYYLKQLVNSGIADLREQLIYALLSGGANGALAAAGKVMQSGDKNAFSAVAALFFIITTAFNTDQLYKSNPQGMSDYSRIIESYFTQEPIEDLTDWEISVLMEYYPYIAFLGGESASQKFLNVYKNAPKERFAAFEVYARRSRNFDSIYNFDISGIDEADWFTNSRKINAAIQSGKLEYAFDKIKKILRYKTSDEVLDMLLLIADKSSGEIQKEAVALYNQYINYFEKMIDWNDIVNTRIVTEKKDARFKKELSTLDEKELRNIIENAPKKTEILGYYNILKDALDIYKEKNYNRQYFNGLIELISADIDKENSISKLNDLLEEAGNSKASELTAAI